MHGYAAVVTPEVTAVVDKAAGKKGTLNLENERKRFREKWNMRLAQPDPCYNINLSLETGCTYALREQP